MQGFLFICVSMAVAVGESLRAIQAVRICDVHAISGLVQEIGIAREKSVI